MTTTFTRAPSELQDTNTPFTINKDDSPEIKLAPAVSLQKVDSSNLIHERELNQTKVSPRRTQTLVNDQHSSKMLIMDGQDQISDAESQKLAKQS